MNEYEPLIGLSPSVRYPGLTERSRTHEPHTISMETDNVFIFVIDGQCIHQVNGRKRLLQRGMMEIIPPYAAQTITVPSDSMVRLFYIYFDLFETAESHRLVCRPGHKDTKRQIPEQELYFIDRETFGMAADDDYDRVLLLFEEIRRLHGTDDPLAGIRQKRAMLELLLIFLQSKKIPETAREWAKRGYVAQAIRHIEKNCADYELCSAAAARHLRVSAPYLSRLFRSELQMTLAQYIRYVRVSRAKELFKLSGHITEVSRKCGFTSIQSFSRTFRQVTGLSPTAWREQNRQDMQAITPATRPGWESEGSLQY